MPSVYFLVGLPGSGKSTWASNNKDLFNAVVISTDWFIEEEAKRQNKSFAEVYHKVISKALKKVESSFKFSIKNKKNIILDQTNLSRKVRIEKLKLVSRDYEKVCIFFMTPKDLLDRLRKRKGKEISESVIKKMKNDLEIPLKKEGWDRVIFIGEDNGY
jgi:predicted kinase